MKELSIAEKMRAYDGNYKVYTELINRFEGVKSAIKKQNYGIAMDILCKPYPKYQITTSTELKESEDEKTKESLMQYIWDMYHKDFYPPQPSIECCDKWLDWLEKQGHTDSIIEKAKTEKQRVIITETNGNANIDWDTRSLEDARRLLECGLQYINTELEKQGEQKHADKVEPKFHEGDFITDGERIFKIKETVWERNNRNDGITYCESLIVNLRDGFTYSNNTDLKEYHLWTIQDAKDGDILCTYECGKPKIVFILKGTIKKHYALSYHCYYNTMYPHFESNSEKGCLAPNDEDVKPATKEYRDILMKAMTDAGYTFDFEKKEPKEIDIKEALRTEYEKGRADAIAEFQKGWSEEDELHIRELENLVKQAWTIAELKIDKDTIHKMSDLSFFLKTLKPQLKQEWSEEDESILQGIWDEILANKHNAKEYEWKTYDKFLDWLKSLKDRVGCKANCTTTKAWSKEDETKLRQVEYACMKFYGGDCSHIDWLRKVTRSQSTWKPSEEQMKALHFVKKAKILDPEERESLNSLYIHLRKLK